LSTSLSTLLCVCTESGLDSSAAEQFSSTNQLTLFLNCLPEDIDDSFPYILFYQRNETSIIQTKKGAPGPVTASFLAGKTTHRLKFGGGKGQMIAKAVGLNKGVVPSVLDATAGLARDAFVLASLGCELTLLERSPVIAELLRGALAQAQGSEVADITARMHLYNANSVDWLESQEAEVSDVIYLDPMYPHRDKSSLVKKEMRLFQALVGEDLDDAALLDVALRKARYRVVVKRPRKGEPISGRKPSLQLVGKSCRYDIYTLKRLGALSDKN
jgi:16S rRNA (guanine1516-N2)-methyltransferase